MSPSIDRRLPVSSARPPVLAAVALVAAIAAGCQPQATRTVEPAAEPATEPAEATPAPEPRRAEVGVGRKGRSLDDETGVGRAIAQPAITLFAVQERAVFDIQIPHALQLFEATEGRKPKSHEEFMQKIIATNQIALPELPEGREYRYDPEKGELWVYPKQ